MMKGSNIIKYCLLDVCNLSDARIGDDAKFTKVVNAGDKEDILKFVDNLVKNKDKACRDSDDESVAVLEVDALSTLGNSVYEIVDVWNEVVAKDVVIKIDSESLCSNDEGTKKTMEAITKMIAKQKQMFSELQKQRMKDAIDRGVRVGRPEKKPTEEFYKVLPLVKDKKMSVRKASELCHVSNHVFAKWMRAIEQ